ncbi:MAG: hypothetical protein JXN60_01250, partial [Lentisphaerae bacterium]|nr:hypothetical protein [Lentisphaerota bacterium]
KIRIVTKTETKRLDIPVLAFAPPGLAMDIQFDPAVAEVALSGRAEALANITVDSIKVFVDCSKLNTPAAYELPLFVHLSSGTAVTTIVEPRTVKVIFGGKR